MSPSKQPKLVDTHSRGSCFDGDTSRRDDIGVVYNDGPGNFSFRILAATGSPGSPTFAAPATWYNDPPGWAEWTWMKPFAGDFDGDGHVDIADFFFFFYYYYYYYPDCQTKMWVHFSTGSSFELSTLMWDSGAWHWCWDWGGEPFAADFDNNGRSDVAAFYRVNICHTQLVPFYGNADRTMTIATQPAWDSGPNAWCPLQTAVSVSDVNADGRPDLTAVYHCCAGYQVKVYTFTASGRTFGPPVLHWAGSMGPAGTRINE